MTPDEARPYRNNRARIVIDPQTIAHFLDLPEGMAPAAVIAQHDPYGICVIVEGPALERVPENAESPLLRGIWGISEIVDDGKGKRFHRFVWERTT